MKILSIETSCDETAAAVVEWSNGQATVLANTVSSQASLHAKWGGVVPDLASREHLKNIVPVITETFNRAKLSPTDIDLLAVTAGPGLMPALVIGVTAAKTLSFIWNKPLIGIQHLEGHIYANFLSLRNDQISPPKADQPRAGNSKEIFPLVALVVSGGHTELVLMKDHFQYEILGETQDDAAGEAFDKVAKMLGLDYPGGPIVAKRADEWRTKIQEQKIAEKFPRPMLDADNFDFSFSGLKTSVLYYLKKQEKEKKDENFIDEVCHEFQEAVVDVLVGKTKKALIPLFSRHVRHRRRRLGQYTVTKPVTYPDRYRVSRHTVPHPGIYLFTRQRRHDRYRRGTPVRADERSLTSRSPLLAPHPGARCQPSAAESDMKVTAIKTEKILPRSTTLTALLDRNLKKLPERSILVITSKIVALCEGRFIPHGARLKESDIRQEADYYLPREKSRYGIPLTIVDNAFIARAGHRRLQYRRFPLASP